MTIDASEAKSIAANCDLILQNVKLAYFTKAGTAGSDATTWSAPVQAAFPETKVIVSGDKTNAVSAKASIAALITLSDGTATKVTADGDVYTANAADEAALAALQESDWTQGESTTAYTLSNTKKDTYVRPIAFKTDVTGAERAATWADITAAIEKNAKAASEYTINLVVDYDAGGAIKMPKKGTYKTLTIKSDKKGSLTTGYLRDAVKKDGTISSYDAAFNDGTDTYVGVKSATQSESVTTIVGAKVIYTPAVVMLTGEFISGDDIEGNDITVYANAIAASAVEALKPYIDACTNDGQGSGADIQYGIDPSGKIYLEKEHSGSRRQTDRMKGKRFCRF